MLQGKKFLLLFAVCIQFVFTKSFGQITMDSLRVDTIGITYPQCPDSAFEGQNYGNIFLLVHNMRSDSAFVGSLSIFVQSQDSTFGNLPVDTLIPFAGITYTIPPNTSVNIFLNGNYDFTPANYRTGSNVVVVWPVTSIGIPFVDSLHLCVNFFPLSGLHEFNLNNAVSIFPNPAEDYLTIKSTQQKFIEGVRIFDIPGRFILSPLWDDSQKIKVDALSAGMYILELTTKDKQKVRKQFVRK